MIGVASTMHYVCKHAGLISSVFNPAIKVQKDYVAAAEPGLRKKCKLVKGTAGPRRARIMAEIKEAKAKSASKIPFMSMQSCSGVAADGELAVPAPSPVSPPPTRS